MFEPIKTSKRFHRREVDFIPPISKCRTKIAHASHRLAEKTRLNIINTKGPQYLRIYKCRWCHKFHLTSQKQRRK